MRFAIALVLVASLPIGCSSGSRDDANTLPTENADAGSDANSSAASFGSALGLTRRQLEGADLVARRRNRFVVGEVESVIMDMNGTVTGLAVEIENTEPDVYVVLPLEGPVAVADGDEWDIDTAKSRDELLSLPRWAP